MEINKEDLILNGFRNNFILNLDNPVQNLLNNKISNFNSLNPLFGMQDNFVIKSNINNGLSVLPLMSTNAFDNFFVRNDCVLDVESEIKNSFVMNKKLIFG